MLDGTTEGAFGISNSPSPRVALSPAEHSTAVDHVSDFSSNNEKDAEKIISIISRVAFAKYNVKMKAFHKCH